MATFKKTAGRRATGSAEPDAAQVSRKLSESAQQIWLAGIGAFGRAQAEGTKLFEALVKEGANFEETARRVAGSGAEGMRDAFEARMGHARERATDTLGKFEQVFEARVQRALVRLGVPGCKDMADLAQRMDNLTAELRAQNRPAARKTAAKPPVKKPATRTVTKAAAQRTARRAPARTGAASAKPRARKTASR